MPKMLNDEAVEYEDGTPATEAQVCFQSQKIELYRICPFMELITVFNFSFLFSNMVQMGKDVVSFLSWAAEPEMEERKLVSFFVWYHYICLPN